MWKHIYEHLKTSRKYNKLMIKYEIAQEKYDAKVVELNTQKRINRIEREKFEKVIEELTQKLVEEKEKNKKKKGK